MTQNLTEFLSLGGPVLWLIALLSVLTLALILWKLWQLLRLGAWSGSATRAALRRWDEGDGATALAALEGRTSLRARLAAHAMRLRLDRGITEETAREEVTRMARADIGEARIGLRALELVSTVAPLLGLLGTVIGMIAAFQALQEAGASSDPADLAGGIWEALLTTAAGMAVAIPAGIGLTLFEGVAERLQADMEDTATRIFTRGPER